MNCGCSADLLLSSVNVCLVCLQLYYVENINSGSADVDAVVQQVLSCICKGGGNPENHLIAPTLFSYCREFIIFNNS